VTDSLVVAICTCRPDDLAARWEHNLEQLAGDEFVVVFDCVESASVTAVADRIRSAGGTVVSHGATRGLAAARNTVLDRWPDRRILFIDDDVLLDRKAADALRQAFAEGANVVGTRLVPPERFRRHPWYFTSGQMHLVGWHPPGPEVKTWGACMGIDAAFAHQHGLRFDMRLGRTGRRLESGDDTSFVAAMKAAGAREQLLPDVHVVHDVDPRRLTTGYLARRAYWQGRSEVRRQQAMTGLRKEWRRYRQPGRAALLAPAYLLAFAVGIGHELVVTRRSG
jgi:hypothetical protein